jgi:hypothetical protein
MSPAEIAFDCLYQSKATLKRLLTIYTLAVFVYVEHFIIYLFYYLFNIAE